MHAAPMTLASSGNRGEHAMAGTETPFTYYRRLGKVKRFVEEPLSEDLSVDRMAGIAGLEKKYFSAFFHQKVGITFTEWFRQFRVAKAIEIMKTRNESIINIAFEVGFGDLRTFERAFKKYTNLTAREFKRSILPERRTPEPYRSLTT